MASRRFLVRPWYRTLLHVTLLAAVLVASCADDSADQPSESEPEMNDAHAAEKRYLAALAKNGRLPKFASSQKRFDDEKENDADSFDKNSYLDEDMGDWTEEKRHIGAFLKAHGRPGSPKDTRSYPVEEQGGTESDSSEIMNNDKRNVATLAGLGRLNAVRFGRFQPSGFGGKKRITYFGEEQNDAIPPSVKDSNEISRDPNNECQGEEDEQANNTEDNFTHPNWIQSQKKRYIAALARSGRLPVWHSQRMWWGGKRDIPRAYWLRYRSGARAYGGKRQNTEESSRRIQEVNKKCKKSVIVSNDEVKPEANEKRNLAMLARQGKLPYRA